MYAIRATATESAMSPAQKANRSKGSESVTKAKPDSAMNVKGILSAPLGCAGYRRAANNLLRAEYLRALCRAWCNERARPRSSLILILRRWWLSALPVMRGASGQEALGSGRL
jgi:hypothetical protein